MARHDEGNTALTKTLSMALAQVNLLVGDIKGNADIIARTARRARDELGSDLVVFPELTLTGYPPEDLLLRPAFIDAAEYALDSLCREVSGVAMVIGHPLRSGRRLYNAASFVSEGRVLGVYRKQHLPNYSVFDEKRYFVPGSDPCVVDFLGARLGLTICEDIWEAGPVTQSARAGAKLVININASPFHLDRANERLQVVAARASEVAVPVAYVNLVGGQDELVFDGASFVVDAAGRVVQRAEDFVEDLVAVELAVGEVVTPANGPVAPEDSVECSAYRAIVTGVRDYIEKNRFGGAIIGLSGGIDSALTLAVAVDALGADRVTAVLMPSRYTAQMSIDDALAEAAALEVEHHLVSIEDMNTAFLGRLKPLFGELAPDSTEENIQARCRGVILMALSNKFGRMVLTTGNKSEMAVGYTTLYGDMAGGFSAIKDVPKTLVYRLAHFRNSMAPVIPERVLQRPPSAELAPGQTDQDSLPPYGILDPILELYIEQDHSPEDIISRGFDPDTVHRVARMVDNNEYKRRQAAPGVRITRRAFGRDRRYPITSGFRA
jgi:NAD+ synthase (glutamine-hydrolysing)